MTGPLEAVTLAGIAAAGVHLLIVFVVGIRVLTQRRPPGSTASWLLLVIMLPYTGALLYLQVEVPIETDAGPAAVQMVPSGPGYDGQGVVQLLLAAVYSAERELTLTTPYFIPNDPLVEALRTAAMRGVQVRQVLPARVDSRMVQHASRAYFDD